MRSIIIVGCGLFGISLARMLADKYQITIYERRNHIGGNCFDYEDKETGILVHKYGPHIIHIDNPNILLWLKQFTDFNNYKHHVKAFHNGRTYDFPINISTLNSFFNTNINPTDISWFFENFLNDNDGNLEERLIRMVGKELYEAFFKFYSEKQWGTSACNIPADVISRIPIHLNHSTDYYKKRFNGIPKYGFTEMFLKILDHKNIRVLLNTEFKIGMKGDDIVVYTGPIDEYFNYRFGHLKYRSLKFVKKTLPITDFQGISVVNYPDKDVAWTRICEPKHFYPDRVNAYTLKKTIVIYEIPGDIGEPCYPIRNSQNISLYSKYLSLAKKIPNIYFAGRMGGYRYYDMENCIADAFALANKLRKI